MNSSILVPMYQWPEAHPNNWSAIITAAAYVGILVLNPNSGPSTAPIGEFVDAAEQCQAAGISVIGYVDSAYGSKSLSDVQTEINHYISWYQVNGFFIDDMYSHDTAQVGYYQQIQAFVKGKSANYSLVYNPGQPVIPEEYMSTADVFCTFEGSAESYNSFVPASYTNDYPSSKFFHQVYGAGTTAAMAATLQQFDEQHAKWLYMTELNEPNPYDPLAGNEPWTALLNYMSQSHDQ